MTVYVDDAFIPAQVGRISSRWCHMVADTEEELHVFAESIGLRRAWFQIPKAINLESRSAQNWHYDVTEGRRAAAVEAGAVPVTSRELSAIIDARHALRFPEAAAVYAANRAKWAIPAEEANP